MFFFKVSMHNYSSDWILRNYENYQSIVSLVCPYQHVTLREVRGILLSLSDSGAEVYSDSDGSTSFFLLANFDFVWTLFILSEVRISCFSLSFSTVMA